MSNNEEPWAGSRRSRRTNDGTPWPVWVILIGIFLAILPFIAIYEGSKKFREALTPTDPDYPEFGMSAEDKRWWISTLIGVLALVGLGVAIAIYCALRSSGGA